MFYSQFILAKKGPLGTIWIAAHLERKLRKNQVADTDIGVSVDSILFPEVPIALRLSSHLLLGVVRIYSRKVNYLFDDCSEALLKIKQAFRSTAVDLPPEESTAPYHSITLPETFDLDDFELPDSDIFQGNYVDHHVSTREQITLQDTMEGVVYTTTQFGLDERFGDGDTSGLDLDEELFLNKVTAPGHVGSMKIPDDEPPASIQQMTSMEQEKDYDGINKNTKLDNLEGDADTVGYAQAPCTPGLIEEPNLSITQDASVCDDHQEELNFSNIEEAMACGDHQELEDYDSTKVTAKDSLTRVTGNSDLYSGQENVVGCSLPKDINPATVSDGQKINQLNSLADSPPPLGIPFSYEQVEAMSPACEFPNQNSTAFDDVNRLQHLHNGVANDNDPGTLSVHEAHSEERIGPQEVRLDETASCPSIYHETHALKGQFGNSGAVIGNVPEKPCSSGLGRSGSERIIEFNQASHGPEFSNDMETAGILDQSCYPSNSVVCNVESPSGNDLENPENYACQDQNDSTISSSIVHEKVAVAKTHVLQPCRHLNQSSEGNPESDVLVAPHLHSGVPRICLTEASGRKEEAPPPRSSTQVQVLEENHSTEPASCENIHSDFSKLTDQVANVIPRETQLANSNGYNISELPAPEKFLSMPGGPGDEHDHLLESTPNREHSVIGDVDNIGTNNISGKKRSFTESTLTVDSLNSVESLGVVQSKRTKESVPDDNDLLSSILVGRRSSVLKMKPSPPPPPELTCKKRPRSAARMSSSKRKILMDDTMVLHGDKIRQQLTQTEDIRRTRKKAPCSRPEIWMIWKEYLEDEIFSEPIFTGFSTGLVTMHSQTYDLSEIRVSQNDTESNFQEATRDLNLVLHKGETDHFEACNNAQVHVNTNLDKETEKKGNYDSVLVRSDAEVEYLDRQQSQNPVSSSQVYHDQVQMEALSNEQEPESLPHERSGEMSDMHTDGEINVVTDTMNHSIANGVEPASSVDPVSVNKIDIPRGSMDPPDFLDKHSGDDGGVLLDASEKLSDQMLETQFVGMDASIVFISSGKVVDATKVTEQNVDGAATGRMESRASDKFPLEGTEGGASMENGASVQTAFDTHSENRDPFVVISPEIDRSCCQIAATADEGIEEFCKNEIGVVNEVENSELDFDGKYPNVYDSGIEPAEASSHPAEELNLDVKMASLSDSEYPGCGNDNLQSIMDTENAYVDHTAAVDHADFVYKIDEHDTGFLNDDDDDVTEEGEDCMPSAEHIGFIDNSGWSSRTRAVAKYIQVLFDKEAELGRKVLPMNNLLLGKTRKEASRMFFEALVLKTRDYIHVEQEAPFENINMKPRVKLMKADF